MRKADFPFLADWFAISLRWLALFSLALTHAVSQQPQPGFLIVSGIAVAWNLALTVLAVGNQRLPYHRLLNVVVDTLTALGLFLLSGGLTGPAAWAGVLALLSAAVYYEWRGALLVALLITLSEAAQLYLAAGLQAFRLHWLALALVAGVNLGLGGLLGALSMRLMKATRGRYRQHVNQQKESEQKTQQRERHRLQVFYGMVETLSATLNYRVVLNTSLDLSASAVGEDPASAKMASAVLLFTDGDLKMAAARGFSPSDQRRTFPAEEGALAEALRSGGMHRLNNPTTDAELGAVHGLQNMRAAVVLPLLRANNAFGVMLFAHPDPFFFNPDRCDLLEMISHQAVVSIQNARLFEDLETEKNRLMESQEEARKKLARDLHDGPTQSVSSIAMSVNIARRMLEKAPQNLPAELERIEELARRTTHEIRHMLFTLRPLALESEGLAAALEQMRDKMREVYQQNVELEISPEVVQQLDMNRQAVVFYLVEEAVNNARKHAEAARIRVQLRFLNADTSLAYLEIADNGKGFDVASVTAAYERRGSLGMVNLQERCELINAALNLESKPGKGTRVQVVIPLTAEAVDRLQRGMVSSRSN